MAPLIVGIAGGTGSGKTAVVSGAAARLDAAKVLVIAHDSYYRDLSRLPAGQRARVNFDHPDALETALLIEHLRTLRTGQAVDIPVYDFATHTRRPEPRRVDPRPVIIVEGLHVLADPGLRKMLDVKIFVHADADLRLIRRMGRDVTERARTFESVVEQYLTSARPMHLRYVEPSRKHADVVVPNDHDIGAAIGQLTALIRDAVAAGKG